MIVEKEKQRVFKEVENHLLTSERINFSFDRKWSSNFPNDAGVYAIFDKDKLVYFGETSNLKERMKEVKRTYNHSFRKKLGKHLFENAIITKGKFSQEIEEHLNEYYLQNISFSKLELSFGRLETESFLIHKNEDLLNSKGKRNKLK